MFQLLIAICVILVATASAGAPKSSKVSAAIKDQATGLDGLNFNFEIPMKIQDYVLGFKYALKDSGNLESLFAKKSYDVMDGSLALKTDLAVKNNVLSVDGAWTGFEDTLTLSASGNTEDKLKSVGFSKLMTVLEDKKVQIAAKYDVLKKTVDTMASVAVDATKVTLNMASEKEPKITVSYDLDDRNSFSPSVTGVGSMADFAYTRKWEGGSLQSKVDLDKVMKFTWKDSGCAGSWTTEAEVPLTDRSATKVSLSRDWDM